MGINQTRVRDGYQPDTGGRWVSTRHGWRWVSTRHRWEMGISQTLVGLEDGCQLWMGREGVKQILTRYTGFSPDTGERWVSTRHGWDWKMGNN